MTRGLEGEGEGGGKGKESEGRKDVLFTGSSAPAIAHAKGTLRLHTNNTATTEQQSKPPHQPFAHLLQAARLLVRPDLAAAHQEQRRVRAHAKARAQRGVARAVDARDAHAVLFQDNRQLAPHGLEALAVRAPCFVGPFCFVRGKGEESVLGGAGRGRQRRRPSDATTEQRAQAACMRTSHARATTATHHGANMSMNQSPSFVSASKLSSVMSMTRPRTPPASKSTESSSAQTVAGAAARRATAAAAPAAAPPRCRHPGRCCCCMLYVEDLLTLTS